MLSSGPGAAARPRLVLRGDGVVAVLEDVLARSGEGLGALDPHDSQLFTGSIEAIQRSKAFSGPGEDVFEDRDNAISSQN